MGNTFFLRYCDSCGGVGYMVDETVCGHKTVRIECSKCGKSTKKFIVDGSMGMSTTENDAVQAWHDGSIHPSEYVTVDGIAKYLAASGYMPSSWSETESEKESAWKDELELAMILGKLS